MKVLTDVISYQERDTNQRWTFFKEKLNKAKSRFVPKTFTGGRKKKRLDKGTLTSVRKKHRLYARWLESKTGERYVEYRKALNKANKDCRKAKRKMEKTVADQAKKNPKSFWSYVKSKTATRTAKRKAMPITTTTLLYSFFYTI